MTKRKLTPKTQKSAKNKRAVSPKTKQKSAWIPALILAILGFLIYANTLGHSYALDDFSVIKDNFVTQKGIQGFPEILTKSYRYGYWNSNGSLYRPLSLITFAVEWQIAPDKPELSHFVNVLLYALTGMLLFFTLSKILKRYTLLLPFLAAAFFMAHPVHSEVVANIKSRDEILAFLFCLGAVYYIWDYLSSNNIKHLLLAVGSFTLAMFSKENAITFLAVIPLLIYCFSNSSLEKNLKTSFSFLAPVVLYLGVRLSVLGSVAEEVENTSVLDNLIMASGVLHVQLAAAFVLLGKYLLSLFFPLALVSDWGYNELPLVGWSDWRAIASLVFWLGIGIWAVLNLKKRNIFAFAIAYFIITFSVYSNLLVTIGSSYGERFLYFASLGFTIALAWALLKITKTGTEAEKGSLFDLLGKYKSLSGISAIILLLFCAKTIDRNPAWFNSYSLYNTDIEHSPNSAKLNYHLGLEQVKKGLKEADIPTKRQWIESGMNSFQKAISIYPQYHDAYGERGLGFFRMGQLDKAMENYELSLKYKPNNANVYSNMGIIYFQKGELEKARDVYEKAVKIDPRFVDARRNLGSVYAQQKRFDDAITQFQTALKYDKNNALLHQYIGYVYRDRGDAANAKVWLDKAKRLGAKLK